MNIMKTKSHLSAADYFKAKLNYEMSPWALKTSLDEQDSQYRIVDVRSPEDFKAGHLPTSINVPLAQLPGMLSSLPRDKTIVTYCGSLTCQLAPRAALELAQKGFNVMELHGGLKEWQAFGFPVEKA
jgi:rhodanese-related sulfurtransferase